ncbi:MULTISPECIES: hypothetical protein [Nonomuraea]|uniref:GRAM domain-containing protein n=1 Tax=Nonomuraea ferruginea TaxID=46174 RepID=A0ABT4TCH9_9ACTN|nr:hypothetical protein [Nonomuraea ferruginea]MDA0646850.1 hypothetical protein [Nonomuraea ferruginea]
MPRARSNADGSVTVPGAVHGFTSIDRENGWIGGWLTISDEKVVHTIDREVKVLRRTVPLEGTTFEIRAKPDAQYVTIALTTADGRDFKINFDRFYDQALARFG